MRTILLFISITMVFGSDVDERREKLLADGIIIIGSPIDEEMAAYVTKSIEHLEAGGMKAVTIYVNSPGGFVKEGLEIARRMEASNLKVTTVAIEKALGMAFVVFLTGQTKYAINHPSLGLVGTSPQGRLPEDLDKEFRAWLIRQGWDPNRVDEVIINGDMRSVDEWIAEGKITRKLEK